MQNLNATAQSNGAWVARWTMALALIVAFSAYATPALGQDSIPDGTVIDSDTTWSGTVELNGLVFVGEETVNDDGTETALPDDRVELTIEPGTVIKGRPGGDGDTPGALIVRRSAQIDAQGTRSRPIIFTSTNDDLSDPDDMFGLSNNPNRGEWGGLILLGRAGTNQGTDEGGGTQIEGIPDETGTRARFGGTNDTDDSGTLRFVSIRHGGFSISGVPGDEINGLTMGALGRGTTIEFVEVFANFDDGFEWFGGTVHTSHLVAAFNADDSFDYDQGFRGSGQYWYSLQATDAAGRAGEHDGGDAAGDGAEPFSRPVISNVTYFGSGQTAPSGGGDANQPGLAIRDNGGGEYYNSIIHDFPGKAATLEDLASGPDTRQRFEQGDLIFENNVFGTFGGGSSFSDLVTYTGDSSGPVSGFGDPNTLQDPGVTIDREFDGEGGTDARPTADLPEAMSTSQFAANGVADVDGVTESEYLAAFEDVGYVGAFDPNAGQWTRDWTYADRDVSETLPVEMANFEVQKDGEKFVLAWATASETNNAGFDVQRSVDGGSFETIGFREGVGTTEQAQTYRFTDANVPFDASTIEYRLRQKDLDGSTETGPTRTVEVGAPSQAELLSPFPNPSTGQATVRYKLADDADVTLSVYNMLGQRVATLVDGEQSAGRKQYTLDTGSFSSGVYFLRLNTTDKIATERLTIVR